jgi:hypothetical protein
MKMYLISPELLKEAISGLRAYGKQATKDTVKKLRKLEETDYLDDEEDLRNNRDDVSPRRRKTKW